MKYHSRTRILLVMFFTILFSVNNSHLIAQNSTSEKKSKIKAAQGDTVLVVMNYIKPEKCKEFEEFIAIMLNAVDKAHKSGKLSEKEVNSLRSVRLLTPVKQNQDGSFTYVFMADPVLANVKTTAPYYLKKYYTDDETKKYMQTFNGCFSKPQEILRAIQSKHFLK